MPTALRRLRKRKTSAPEEAEWLTREANAKLVTLGPRILRTETAAIASQTIVMALRGEME